MVFKGYHFNKKQYFRQDDIVKVINNLKNRPVITAFTATATEQVRGDILKLLGLNNPYKYSGSFNRDNLVISVYIEEDKLEFVKDKIKENELNSGII